MKKQLFYIVILLGLVFSSCEPQNLSSNKVLTGTASDITSCSAVLSGELKADASDYKNIGVGIMIAETQDDIDNYAGELLDGKLLNGKRLEGKEFKIVARDLLSNKKYFYRAVIFINNTEYEYGAVETFVTTEVPKNGFSISETRRVVFSPGNLQYQASTKKWRFAEGQWQCIGGDNANISSKYSGWVDLFGWSTNAGAAAFGVSTSTKNEDYSGDFVDWGINQIGDDVPNMWRTLKYREWRYLVFDRPNAPSLRGIAQVNGVNGLILLPDEWVCPSGVNFKSGFHSEDGKEYFADYQSFSLDEWMLLEDAGAVFLPAGGCRIGTTIVSEYLGGIYWSSSDVIYVGRDYNRADYICFYSNDSYVTGAFCEYGLSVRLVKDL